MCNPTAVEALASGASARDSLLQTEGNASRSWLAAVDPRARLLASFAFAVAVVALDRLAPLALALALALGVVLLAGLPARRLKRTVAALDGSMLFVVATLPFTTPGEPSFSFLGCAASVEGFWRAVEIALKANAVTLMTLALIGACELPEIGHALLRLGVPAKLAHLLLMTVRYVDVIGDEYRRLRTAMALRGFRMGCNLHSWRSLGHLFGMLFARSFDRAARIGAAMRCRGFTGAFPVLTEFAYSRRDAAFFAAAASAIAALLMARLV